MIKIMNPSEMGRKGGKARWRGVSKEARSEATRKSINIRWERERAKRKLL